MAEIVKEAGTLAPPACYATEQERFEAYVEALILTITGGIQWESDQTQPADLEHYWLELDATDVPLGAASYTTTYGGFVPWLWEVVYGIGGGAASAYTFTSEAGAFPSSASVIRAGRTLCFVANHASTGVAATITVDGFGPFDLKKQFNEDLLTNDIVAGQVVTITSDGTQFQVVSSISLSNVNVASLAPGTDEQFLSTVSSTTAWQTRIYHTVEVSCQAVPAAGSAITFAHGLGKIPYIQGAFLKCNDAGGDAGYSDNDEVNIFSAYWSSGDNEVGFAVSADATNIYVTRDNQMAGVILPNRSTGAHDTLDEGKWKIGACAMI